ncbi:MAG: membrane-bound ClpP family serine protease [Cyclobacteriaceae bacterium]
MDWIIVISLIVFGLGLIIVEVIFVPGTTVVGIAGLIIGTYGVYEAYSSFGTTTGHVVLGITILTSAVSLILALKSKSWERFSLSESNTGRVNDDFKVELNVGDIGKTISSIKPVGKALFNDVIIEVRSNGEYIAENQNVKVLRVEPNKIVIEPINNK